MLGGGGGGGGLNIETELGGTGTYDKEMINDMGKTSNFGGHLPSAQLPNSPTGQRLLYQGAGGEKQQQNNQ